MKKILFCGGGTAGHVTPNIALIEKFSGRFSMCYLGVGGIERTLIKPFAEKGVFYSEFPAVKLKRKLSPELFRLPKRLYLSVKSCEGFLSLYKPDIVVSKGGYGGLPVVIASKKLKIPAIAHESDFSLGLANRLCLPLVEKMFAVFPNAVKQSGKKGVLCAVPLREEVFGNAENALKECRFSRKKPVLLVLGGSLGSERINSALSASLGFLTEKFNVIALTGRNKAVSGRGDGLYQREFAHKIGDFYACADVVLSRAGSNTLSELTANNLPALLVPLESGSRGEQLRNAEFYEKKGCAKVLREKELTPLSLKTEIENLFIHRDEIKRNLGGFIKSDSIMEDYIINRLL